VGSFPEYIRDKVDGFSLNRTPASIAEKIIGSLESDRYKDDGTKYCYNLFLKKRKGKWGKQ
jgi:hypothetical protein